MISKRLTARNLLAGILLTLFCYLVFTFCRYLHKCHVLKTKDEDKQRLKSGIERIYTEIIFVIDKDTDWSKVASSIISSSESVYDSLSLAKYEWQGYGGTVNSGYFFRDQNEHIRFSYFVNSDEANSIENIFYALPIEKEAYQTFSKNIKALINEKMFSSIFRRCHYQLNKKLKSIKSEMQADIEKIFSTKINKDFILQIPEVFQLHHRTSSRQALTASVLSSLSKASLTQKKLTGHPNYKTAEKLFQFLASYQALVASHKHHGQTIPNVESEELQHFFSDPKAWYSGYLFSLLEPKLDAVSEKYAANLVESSLEIKGVSGTETRNMLFKSLKSDTEIDDKLKTWLKILKVTKVHIEARTLLSVAKQFSSKSFDFFETRFQKHFEKSLSNAIDKKAKACADTLLASLESQGALTKPKFSEKTKAHCKRDYERQLSLVTATAISGHISACIYQHLDGLKISDTTRVYLGYKSYDVSLKSHIETYLNVLNIAQEYGFETLVHQSFLPSFSQAVLGGILEKLHGKERCG